MVAGLDRFATKRHPACDFQPRVDIESGRQGDRWVDTSDKEERLSQLLQMQMQMQILSLPGEGASRP